MLRASFPRRAMMPPDRAGQGARAVLLDGLDQRLRHLGSEPPGEKGTGSSWTIKGPAPPGDRDLSNSNRGSKADLISRLEALGGGGKARIVVLETAVVVSRTELIGVT